MDSIKEAKRLVQRYDCVFKMGTQKQLDRPVHIGVLETAIILLKEEIDSLSEQIQHWSSAIDYAYTDGSKIPKWMILHRFIMFLLTKFAEGQYERACERIKAADECKGKLEGFLEQFMRMEAWGL